MAVIIKESSTVVSCSITSTVATVQNAISSMPIEAKIPQKAILGMRSLAKSNKEYLNSKNYLANG